MNFLDSEILRADSPGISIRSLFISEYNTKNQNAQDSNYFNISLVMFPIWDNETDARYFYVEQAMVGREDKPYRQRVYKI